MEYNEFLEKSREVHGDKYEYVPWEGSVPQNTKIKIICPVHGEFEQILKDHLRGHGCNRCGGSYKMTNEEFKEKMHEIYGNSLDFSESEFINTRTHIKVICPIHGEFYSTLKSLLDGVGCSICNFMNNKNLQSNSFWKLCSKEQRTKWIIEKLKQIHNDKYSYELINEINSAEDVVRIICPEHGIFEQKLKKHLHGSRCPECNKMKPITYQRFIEKANIIHHQKYEYPTWNNGEKITVKSKVNICCPLHGMFSQTINDHLNGCGCQKCGGYYRMTKKEFKDKVIEIFGDKVDLSMTQYNKAHDKIIARCPEHGDFETNQYSLFNGIGCPICRFLENKRSLPFWKLPTDIITKYVIEKFKIVHGDKYSYYLINEIKSEHDYVDIMCNRDNKIFSQQVHAHLSGNGCPYCKQNKFEESVELRLMEENISYEKYKKFKWLGLQNFDFYLPEYKIAIECQGSQHFESIKMFGGDKGLKDTIERDIRKYNLSKVNNQKLLYLLYPSRKCNIDYINGFQEIYTEENTFKTIEELIKKIRETF